MGTCIKMAKMLGSEQDEYSLKLEETELRLGLPGGDNETVKNSGKRGFSETVDLKLNLQTADSKDLNSDHAVAKEKNLLSSTNDPGKPPPPKAQVVGWPPVRSFRKNILSVQSTNSGKDEGEKVNNSATFVKVSMDGAPYLRKVDLKMYKSYEDLSHALEKMFSSFTMDRRSPDELNSLIFKADDQGIVFNQIEGNCGSQGMNGRDFMNESKLMDLLNGSEYVPTYEDKDGDWMLVGDVPWEMFVDSCKRLRIMKGSEAIGLAPRAVEKCKKRS